MSIAFDPVKLVVATILLIGAFAALFVAIIASEQASKWWFRLLVLAYFMFAGTALAFLMNTFHVCHR